jgi:hypothetical protein
MSLARSWPKLKTVFLAVLIICTYDWRLKIQLLRWDFDDVFQVFTCKTVTVVRLMGKEFIVSN